MRTALVMMMGLISAAFGEAEKPKFPTSPQDQITVRVIKMKEGGGRLVQVKAQANAEPLKVIAKSPNSTTKKTVAPWQTVIFEFKAGQDYSVEGWEKGKKVDEETATKKTGTDHI
jgi:hypothetical protein